MNKGVWTEFAEAIVTRLVTLVLGGLVTKRVITDEMVRLWTPEMVSGIIGFGVLLGRALWTRYKARLFASVAMSLPATDAATVKKHIHKLSSAQAAKRVFKE